MQGNATEVNQVGGFKPLSSDVGVTKSTSLSTQPTTVTESNHINLLPLMLKWDAMFNCDGLHQLLLKFLPLTSFMIEI